MNNEEWITSLKDIRNKLIDLDTFKEELKEEAEILQMANDRKPVAVEDFDKDNKEGYIISKIGEEPPKPKGIIRLAIPVYLSKMKEYRQALEVYMGKYSECEEQYYTDYSDERNRLDQEEHEIIEKNKQIAERNYAYKKDRFEALQKNIEASNILSEKLRNVEVIDKLTEYFQDQRVDSIKEAINLYYEEEHRQRMEELIKEQARLAREAIDRANEAIDTAEDAMGTAEQALIQANYAVQVAEEANDSDYGYNWDQSDY